MGKMTREDTYLLGCLLAIHRLQEKGSKIFTVKVDGKWVIVSWDEVCEWIEDQYAIEMGDAE